ncbi:MAG: hypothetical protein QM610_14865 [Chitinophagaceae bacterium]
MNDVLRSLFFNISIKPLVRCGIVSLCVLLAYVEARSQRQLGDCTIYYSVTYQDKDSVLVNAFKTVYIHGGQVRTDFSYNTANYLQTILQNTTTGYVNILKEIGPNKYKAILDSSDWRIKNNMYQNATTVLDTESVVVILGYRCGKALLSLENGSKYNVYYTLDVVPSAKENKYQFKDIPGIVMRYESVDDSNADPIVIHARSINLMPISEHLFHVPSRGYRILGAE